MNRAPLNRRRFLRIAAVQSAALGLGGLLAGPLRAATPAEPRRWRGIGLGGEVGIDLYGGAVADDTFAACRREILRLERVFSLYDDRSALSQLNRTGRLENPPPELIEVLHLAQRVSEVSAGAFDVTIHPLCEALAAGERDEARLAEALARVDYRALQLTDETVRLDRPGMAVTLNGIAQGYITDRVTDVLAARGFTTALVDLGEKRALGAHPADRPWQVGIRSPMETGLAGVAQLQAGQAIATSGGYGQVYASGGRHHLLDARRGESRRQWASVSVIAPTATIADALSTALAVAEPMAAEGILRAFSGARAEVLDTDGAWHRLGAA